MSPGINEDRPVVIIPPTEFKQREKTVIKNILLCIPGPANYSPNVLKSLGDPIATPICKEYYGQLEDIKAGLRYMFQTRSSAVACVSGSGHAGMEAVLCNLLEPGETVLVLVSGMWDSRAVGIARRYDIIAEELHKEPNGIFSLESIEDGLREYRPKALFVTHGDSSSGTLQPLEGLGGLCEKYESLLIVDAVASVGGVPFYMDEWKIDAVYSATQKVLGGPAGLSPLAFSDKALERIRSRTKLPPHYLDVTEILKQWQCGHGPYYHHTLSGVLLNGLQASLEDLVEEGLEAIWERVERTCRLFLDKTKDLTQVKPFVPNPEHQLPTVVALQFQDVKLPPVIIQYFRDNGILIMIGLGPTSGKSIRFGFMGVTATEDVAELLAVKLHEVFDRIDELVANFDYATNNVPKPK